VKLLIVLLVVGRAFLVCAVEKPIAELERQAASVLALRDTTKIRNQIDPLFELAARYASAGESNKAIDAYTRALEHHAWNLSAQLALAQIFDKSGQREKAQSIAELVFKHGETDELQAGSAALLGKPFDATLPKQTLSETVGVALTPVGPADTWLLRELRDALKGFLGVAVVIQPLALNLGAPDRDPLHIRAQDLRMRLQQAKGQPDFENLIRSLKIDRSTWTNDTAVLETAERIFALERDPLIVRNFRDELKVLRNLGSQWDAAKILARMETISPFIATNKVVLGVTSSDLYADQSRFLFGLAATGGGRAVMSYRRFTAAAFDTAPNRETLTQRALKQAVSSIGNALGIPRCTDPTCVRAYVHNLSEHDAKQPSLCNACRGGFAARWGK